MMYIREVEIHYRDTAIAVEHAKLNVPEHVVAYMKGAIEFRIDQEQLWVILLDARLQAMGRFLCHLGTASACLIHPREVFRPAIVGSACNIIVVHNHPSGDPSPSDADKVLTKRLKSCGELLNIQLLDHVILGRAEADPKGQGYYSFME